MTRGARAGADRVRVVGWFGNAEWRYLALPVSR